MSNLIIQFVVYSGLLYLSYFLLFKHLSFYQLNRVVLLGIPIAAFLVPLLAPLYSPVLPIEIPNIQLLEVTVAQQKIVHGSTLISAPNWLVIFYYAVTSVILLGIGRGLFKGFTIARKAEVIGTIRFSKMVESPFTFFNVIIIPNDLKDKQELQTIINHENVHVAQKHGIDNLYYSLLSALAWFNPFVHLLAKELRQTHECLADEQALKNTSREEYAMLLLSSAFGKEIQLSPMAMGTASPFFNSSLIKTRIKMIYKEKSSGLKLWSYLALVPLLAGMTLMSCSKTEAQTVDIEKQQEAFEMNQVEQVPLFTDCDANASAEEQKMCFQQGIKNYIGNNFRYPDAAYNLGLEGKIFVEFIIDRSGEVKEASIKRGLQFDEADKQAAAEETNNYAVKLVKGMPAMSPALKDGKKVAMKFVLPIQLKMPPKED